MLKSLCILIAMVNPFSYIQRIPFFSCYKEPTAIVAMGKGEGPAVSKATQSVTNKVNPPGCSLSSSTNIREDGTEITRETLTCTKETIRKPSGKIKTKPDPKSPKFNSPTVKNFFEGSSSNSKK